MKILWITNITFPEVEALLSGNNVLKTTGGWMLGAAEALIENDDVKLTVATVSKKVKELTRIEGERICYFLLPYGKGNHYINHEYEPLWKRVSKMIQPDVVHLHGTEFTHGLAYIRACGSKNVCVSIQGLVSACYYYYYYGISRWKILKSATPYSLYYGGIMKGYNDFRNRASSELEILRQVNHVIGRTSWDEARIWAINPNAIYHYCNETLRREFYEGNTWQYDKCSPHSIFLSQANYPIKGLHMVLRAMPLILRDYPDAKLRIAGANITRSDTLKQKLLLSDYGKMCLGLIKKNNLERCVFFTGPLDGEGMRKEYLNSNAFICPSSIENSPNSIGEAQLLGVPVIASYVGGVPDMMKGDESHLYRFEEVEMLAYKVVQLFSQKGDMETETMRKKALYRHDPRRNMEVLMSIYELVK